MASAADATWALLHSHLVALSHEVHTAEEELQQPLVLADRFVQLFMRRRGQLQLPCVAVVAVRQGGHSVPTQRPCPRLSPVAQEPVFAVQLPVQVR